jgi:AraC family transcriptional regulator
MDGSHDNERVNRSAHGLFDVRCVTRVSNDIVVHSVQFGVLPGRAWADLSSDTHATLAIALEEIGGRVEARLKPDDPSPSGCNMSFTPPGTPIWGYTDGIRRVHDLRLDFDFARVSEALGQKLIMPAGPQLFRDERLRYLAKCLAAECENPDEFSRLCIDHLTVVACIDFLRLSSEKPPRVLGRLAPWQLRRATEYIMDHLSEQVGLNELAAITGLSQSYFGRAFKASTGLSPHRWQLNARIAQAQRLLLSHSLTHTEIALLTGFAEQSHFCRVFKRMVGLSPAAWQREHFSPARVTEGPS